MAGLAQGVALVTSGRQFHLYQSATAGLWVQHLPVRSDVPAPGGACHPGFKPGASASPALAFEARVPAGPGQQPGLYDLARTQQCLDVFFEPRLRSAMSAGRNFPVRARSATSRRSRAISARLAVCVGDHGGDYAVVYGDGDGHVYVRPTDSLGSPACVQPRIFGRRAIRAQPGDRYA